MHIKLSLVLAVGGAMLASTAHAQSSPPQKSLSKAELAKLSKETGLREITIQQIHALEVDKAARTPAQKKLASSLIYANRMWQGQDAAPGVQFEDMGVETDFVGRVRVDIKGTITPELLNAIQSRGGKVLVAHPKFGMVTALLGLGWVEQLAARDDVRTIRPADQPTRNSGSVNSQGDFTHAADTARTTFATNGSGVKIGVISDSFNNLGAAGTDVSLGDLPGATNPSGFTTPVTLAGSGDMASGGSDEGRAMLQIVHDIAPGAQLYYATAFNGFADFAANVIALRNAGCDIIVDDISYFYESPFQPDAVTQAVDTVTASGALYFSSAANSGNKFSGTSGVWEGDFSDGGASASPLPLGLRLHSFSSGVTANTLTLGGRPILKWSDPLGASSNDYDLFSLTSTGALNAASTGNQDGTQDPLEDLGNRSTGRQIVIGKFSGDARFLHLNTNRGQLAVNTTGVVYGHNAGENTISVAAAASGRSNSSDGPFFFGNLFSSTSAIESFSSDGPRRVFYDTTGTALTPGNFSSTGGVLLQKPDITAADGVSTTLPGSSGLNPFYGTSAAAPHAAAIAGLVKSYEPTLSAADIKKTLFNTAIDLPAYGAGWDNTSGFGIAMASSALASVPKPKTVAVGSITSSAATVTWTTTPASSSVVEFGTTPSYGSSTSVAGNVTSHSVGLSGLTANTLYHYRVKSTNSFGVTVASADSTFTTAAATAATPRITISSVNAGLTRFDIVVNLNLKNSGGDASRVNITSATLGSNGTTTALPVSVGSLAANGTSSQRLNFPSQAPGTTVLRITGTYAGGSFSTSVRVVVLAP